MSSRFATITSAAISGIEVKDQMRMNLQGIRTLDPDQPYRVLITLNLGEGSGEEKCGFALSFEKAVRLLKIVGIGGGVNGAQPRIITAQGRDGTENIGRPDERENGGVFWMLPERSRS
jgi:hypothetical protein